MVILYRKAASPRTLTTSTLVCLQGILVAFIFLGFYCMAGNVRLLSAETLDPAQNANSEMSDEMRSAIKLFDDGNDSDAMDRFLEVLTQGRPSERPLANEYLNLLAQRMSVNGTFPPPAPAEPAAPYARPVAPGQTEKLERTPEPTFVLTERTRNDIERRIRARKRAYLDVIKDMEGVRLVMADSNNPLAIGIPSSLLFDKGILFRKDSARFLQSLTGLVYSLGAAQVVLLPEGFALGDYKVLDMRRTMAVSSQLLSGGVAPPRVSINLLQSQIDLPKAMSDFRGVIALFLYDQPLPLKPEHVLAEASGPPISLGVFPDNLRWDLEQGALIEFSVAEPPSGLTSWRFRIMPPGGRTASMKSSPIQQITGGGAVFHQVYWNGHKGYWGAVFPEGRYKIVLSATDSKGRTSTLRRWLTLRGENPLAKAPAPKPKASARSHRKTKAQSPGVHKHHKPKPAEAAESPKPAPAESAQTKTNQSAPTPASPGAGGAPGTAGTDHGLPAAPSRNPDAKSTFSYRISFISNTQTLTQEGEQRLAQAADAMGVYPLANLNVVGHAGADETDPNALAGNRAKAVSSMLTSKYSVDPKRITLQTKVTEASQPEVEIFIVAGKE